MAHCRTGPLPHPISQRQYIMGGRVAERAEQAKVPAMRSIVGMPVEGGAALEMRSSAHFQTDS